MRKSAPFSVVFAFIATVLIVIIALAAYNQPPQDKPLSGSAGGLHVSESGSMFQTDVPGGQLQQAAAPENSGASAAQTPQQAQPNYCTEGEVPVVEGCVAR